jgi:hypothetical protein
MKVQNGIDVFEKGDPLPPVPSGLNCDVPVISRFGFKIAHVAGRAFWEAASEADYRKCEAERLGIDAKDVSLPALDGCRSVGGVCSGACGFGFCHLLRDPTSGYRYCGCA